MFSEASADVDLSTAATVSLQNRMKAMMCKGNPDRDVAEFDSVATRCRSRLLIYNSLNSRANGTIRLVLFQRRFPVYGFGQERR
jgi:hypothetical protein